MSNYERALKEQAILELRSEIQKGIDSGIAENFDIEKIISDLKNQEIIFENNRKHPPQKPSGFFYTGTLKRAPILPSLLKKDPQK